MESQELLPEGKILQDEILAGTERADSPSNEVPEPHDHGKNLIESPLVEPVAKSLELRVCEVLRTHRIGLWIIFGHAHPAAIAAAVAVALGIHLFVLFYEEPTLRAKFGADYDEYCRNVNRWWPRLRGWDK